MYNKQKKDSFMNNDFNEPEHDSNSQDGKATRWYDEAGDDGYDMWFGQELTQVASF